MGACLQEDCANWNGGGCPCRVLDIDPVDVRCECVGYTIRTDYGTGVEHDVDRSACPLHGEGDDPAQTTDRAGDTGEGE